jgi:hypothetical protein
MEKATSLVTIVDAIEEYMTRNPTHADKLQTILAYEIANFSPPKKKRAPISRPSQSTGGSC